MPVTYIKHSQRLINTDDPASFEALRHRPSHATRARRQVEDLFVALQREHFSQFLGEISTDPRGAAVELRRVLRIMKMSFVPVAMPVFVIVAMIVIVRVLVVMSMPMNVLATLRVLMPVVVFMFMTVMMSVVMLVAVLVLVVMLMFVAVVVLMFVFVFFAHGFAIPSLKFDFLPAFSS